MRTQKRYLIVTIAIACALMSGCLAGCAQSDVQTIRDTIGNELESVKSLDDDAIETLSVDMDTDTLGAYGIDGTDFMKAYLKDFDYTINDIVISEDTAQVTVTLKCKSYTDFQNELSQEVNDLYTNDEIWYMNEDELSNYLGYLIMNSVDSVDVANTEKVAIDYIKVDNVWEPSEDSSKSIVEAILSN